MRHIRWGASIEEAHWKLSALAASEGIEGKGSTLQDFKGFSQKVKVRIRP